MDNNGDDASEGCFVIFIIAAILFISGMALENCLSSDKISTGKAYCSMNCPKDTQCEPAGAKDGKPVCKYTNIGAVKQKAEKE